MKLYVCWGTYREPFHEHACRTAHQALLAAGYEPEVIKVRGLGVGPKLLQWTTAGRREVEECSGQKVVPVLLTDADETKPNGTAGCTNEVNGSSGSSHPGVSRVATS